jgi:tRNA A-37 threonylcarbamoyl transferase component Bud32/tetratricopeptide (TPR) repeat protein
LAIDDLPDRFLLGDILTTKDDDRPQDQPAETIEISRSSPPTPKHIGRYTIQGVIASGGMGTVYKAVQENPRRAVAVKVMKAGVNSASELRRFEFEAQLLGRLRHTGIAQIFEAGTHQEGGTSVPFFAMEYIPNAKSITRYADEKKLGTRGRLELFQHVCEAVHHGHQKGIIHRDLKPENILVGPNGSPHIIDFGVARATDSDMALTLHQTDVGQLIGTVQYMSPEQCEADPHDIDIRSDVYSLGIVLYELLCERLPYNVNKVSVFEATRLIRNQDPPRPSTINSKLRGDLETIVLKSMEKDRDRRYQSAAELGQDVARYLSGDAITARPATAAYQLRVFARRNKGFLAAASAVVVVLVAGIIVSSTMYFRSRNFELQVYEQEAKVQGAQIYLQDIMESISTIGGDEVSISTLLETFGKNIHERFANQPEVEVQVRFDLAMRYDYLSLYRGGSEAKEFSALAEEHFNEALRLQRELYGENAPQILETLEFLADHLGTGFDLPRAESMLREALKIRLDTDSENLDDIMSTRVNLADVLVKEGKLKEAAALNQQALDHFQAQQGADDPRTLDALTTYAWIRQLEGKHREAEATRLELLETTRRISETGSDEERDALQGLANVYVAEGKIDEAAEIYEETRELSLSRLAIKKWLLEDHVIDANAPTLLFFWESWCPYCQLSVPELKRLRAEVGDPLQLIGMTSLNYGQHQEDAERFVQRNGLNFPNAVYDAKVLGDFGTTSWPFVAALHKGNVVWKGHPAGLTQDFLEGLVRGRPVEF